MAKFTTTRLVAHAPDKMFDLVADIGRYPEFVPLCTALKVRRRAPGEGGTEILTADMEVGYRAIREKFTSRVTLDRAAMRINAAYIDGPFSHMDNRWSFEPEPGAPEKCRVGFYIDYAFKSRTFTVLMGGLFDAAFRKLAGAFEARADEIYGRG